MSGQIKVEPIDEVGLRNPSPKGGGNPFLYLIHLFPSFYQSFFSFLIAHTQSPPLPAQSRRQGCAAPLCRLAALSSGPWPPAKSS